MPAIELLDNLAPTPRSKDPYLNKEIGLRLRKWRRSNHWSLDDMSDMVIDRGYHLGKDSYRNYERGTLPPARVLLILRKLGLDLNWYITGDGDS